MFNFFRIRYKVTLGLLLIMALVFCPLGYFVVNFQHNEIIQSLKSEGDGVASLVAYSSGQAIIKYQNNRLDETGQQCLYCTGNCFLRSI